MIELGADPHRILGAHEADSGGVVVRTYRPDAQSVRVQPAGVAATLKDPAGLWEALLPKAKLPLEYELEVEYVDGTFTVRDPYAFLPTLGDLDLHLMRSLGSSGIWELFIPGIEEGAKYKFELHTQDGRLRVKADPLAFAAEVP